jgi:transglutaminase-like putative cysteine protease
VRYRITHATRYRYPSRVHGSLNELRLKPRSTPGQRLNHFQMDVDPRARYLAEHLDAFGNPTSILGIEQVHQAWSVTTVSEVTRLPAEAELPFEPPLPLTEALERLRADSSPAALDARCFGQPSPLLPALPDLLQRLGLVVDPGQGVEALGGQLSRFIFEAFAYRPGQTEISTPLQQVIERRVGVCQDFAHLAIACGRALAIPARYVSGYLETSPPPGAERLVGADATHAWFALYDPARGWLDFDPTNDAVPDHRYITLAWGRDYSDVAPIRGVVRGGGASHTLTVSVDVQRVEEVAAAAGGLLQSR